MQGSVNRRTFLEMAGGAALARVAAAQDGSVPSQADVVVIGGDPAALTAVSRLSRERGLRVVLLADTPPWQAGPPPPAASIAAQPPFVRGHQVCFDTWRDLGNPGWGYEDVLPAFRRLERYEAGESEYRGGSGPIPVAHCWDPHLLHRAFLMASVSGGYQQDSRHDFNGPRTQGIAGYYQKVQSDDRPRTFEELLLEPAAAAGVAVLRELVVSRLVVDGGRVAGVEFTRGGATHVVRATRAVLLCAPAVRAAQILMLSGIGPGDQLRMLGIPVVADRPGVGTRLQEHLTLPLRWQALPPALALPASTVTAGMFTVSLNASPPDLQMDYLDPRAAGGSLLGIDITLVQPASRGDVRLRTTGAGDAPIVTRRAVEAPADVTALVQGVRLARLIAGSPQLDRWRGDETAGTGGAQTQATLDALVKAAARPTTQLAGTCAMGRDGGAVVDATLAAHGVTGLRVAGAAIMPVIVNGPPDAAALMTGDRVAEFVLRAK